MEEVSETPLPGLGIRYGVTTRNGRSLGVVAHQTGRRDLVIYDERDPDATRASVELTEEEARTLGDLLGGVRLIERLDDLALRLEGLAIEWLTVGPNAELAGQTLAEAEVRNRTGANVVALVRDGSAIAAPGGHDQVLTGDTAVVVGSPEAVEAVSRLLDASS